MSKKLIDYSEVPELTDEQLARARRVGRPLLGRAARQLVAIRIDPDVLGSLRAEAARAGIGYQTLIHRVLEGHVGRVDGRQARDRRSARPGSR